MAPGSFARGCAQFAKHPNVRERTFGFPLMAIDNRSLPTHESVTDPREFTGNCQKKSPTALRVRLLLIWRLAVTYSRTRTPALPSAMHRFTAEFDMGSGGSNALLPPGKRIEALAKKASRISHPGPLDTSRVSLWIPDTPAAVRNDGRVKLTKSALQTHRKQANAYSLH